MEDVSRPTFVMTIDVKGGNVQIDIKRASDLNRYEVVGVLEEVKKLVLESLGKKETVSFHMEK